MVLELFDVTQAIVNNYPEFYLGNSEVVLCEDVPSLDGLPFDIMMFKQKYENTTSTFLVTAKAVSSPMIPFIDVRRSSVFSSRLCGA